MVGPTPGAYIKRGAPPSSIHPISRLISPSPLSPSPILVELPSLGAHTSLRDLLHELRRCAAEFVPEFSLPLLYWNLSSGDVGLPNVCEELRGTARSTCWSSPVRLHDLEVGAAVRLHRPALHAQSALPVFKGMNTDPTRYLHLLR